MYSITFETRRSAYLVFEQTVETTEPQLDSQYQQTREKFVDALNMAGVHGIINQLSDARRVMQILENEMNGSSLIDTDSQYKGLYEDLVGQVAFAIADLPAFSRWGRHYLLSLGNAHANQACNNFKDPGLQDFGGTTFKMIRDRADGIVNELPPPKPSGSVGGYGVGSSAPTKPITRAHMQQVYNNPSGGCIDTRECFVTVVHNGGQLENICLGDLKAGDVVKTHTGEDDVVEAVVIFEGEFIVINLSSGLLITDHHPVLINGRWVHPKTLNGEYKKSLSVGTVLLKNRSSTIMVNGTPCATLAHGIENDTVATHDYLGTEKVVEDLKQNPSYETTGRIVLPADCFLRSTETGCIIGMNVV